MTAEQMAGKLLEDASNLAKRALNALIDVPGSPNFYLAKRALIDRQMQPRSADNGFWQLSLGAVHAGRLNRMSLSEPQGQGTTLDPMFLGSDLESGRRAAYAISQYCIACAILMSIVGVRAEDATKAVGAICSGTALGGKHA